jgi:hypothetical protein
MILTKCKKVYFIARSIMNQRDKFYMLGKYNTLQKNFNTKKKKKKKKKIQSKSEN